MKQLTLTVFWIIAVCASCGFTYAAVYGAGLDADHRGRCAALAVLLGLLAIIAAIGKARDYILSELDSVSRRNTCPHIHQKQEQS